MGSFSTVAVSMDGGLSLLGVIVVLKSVTRFEFSA